MKLRLKGNEGNSLRLRVSRSEMQRLLRGEAIVEEVRLGGTGVFRYALDVGGSDSVTIAYTPGEIRISVPAGRMQAWGLESETGIYETLTVGEGSKLELVLEKDFACLDRDDADNADTFPHPHAGAAC